MEIGDVLFNAAAFLAGLSLLERGARLFVSSATTLADRLHLPEMLVGILIAGAEWEELAVVTLSLAQRRPALAVGNIIGSSIANIFGAFALGLIFSTRNWDGFDQGSKVACLGLLGLTTFVSLFALADILWYRVVAVILLSGFVVYILFVLWSIWRAMSEAKKDDDHHHHNPAEDVESGPVHDHLDDDAASINCSASSRSSSDSHPEDANESTSLLKKRRVSRLKNLRHSILPACQLLGSFVALALSGFILSHTSALLAASFDMSDSAFGATILSLATTLPEKFLAVTSGSQGHSGLLVADAVGSNVFLLTLCLGIAAWSIAGHQWHDHPDDGQRSFVDVSRIEAWWMWASAIALTAVVFIGSKDVFKVTGVRQMLGALLLMAYGGFLAVEFTVLRD